MTSPGDFAELGEPGHFFECPRWHGGRWWYSDMRGRRTWSLAEGEAPRVEFEVDDRPAGLGFTPEGLLMVVSMEARRIYVVRPGGSRQVERVIELGHLFPEGEGYLNDMAARADGHVYVGFDPDHRRFGLGSTRGAVVHLRPDGSAEVAARDLAFPNGMVFAPGGQTLIVMQTMQPVMMGFTIAPDGSLGPGEPWAALSPRRDAREVREPPLPERVSMDGCAIDAAGHVWVADVAAGCLRVAPGGDIVEALALPRGLHAIACALGGPDGRTLLVCGADDDFEDRESRKASHLFATRVEVPAP